MSLEKPLNYVADRSNLSKTAEEVVEDNFYDSVQFNFNKDGNTKPEKEESKDEIQIAD